MGDGASDGMTSSKVRVRRKMKKQEVLASAFRARQSRGTIDTRARRLERAKVRTQTAVVQELGISTWLDAHRAMPAASTKGEPKERRRRGIGPEGSRPLFVSAGRSPWPQRPAARPIVCHPLPLSASTVVHAKDHKVGTGTDEITCA